MENNTAGQVSVASVRPTSNGLGLEEELKLKLNFFSAL